MAINDNMEMRLFIVCIMTAVHGAWFPAISQNVQFEWAFGIENQGAPTGYVGTGHDIVLFDEYVYIAGTYAGTADFDPGSGVFELTSTGLFDIFIQKLDTNGNFIWAAQFGGPGNDGNTTAGPPWTNLPEPLGLSLNVNVQGDLILTGTFTDSIDCDPDLNDSFFLQSGLAGLTAGFILKLSADGELIWAKRASSASSNVYSSDLDASGNIYLAGNFSSWAPVDFDPSATGEHFLTANSYDIFVQKLHPDGELDWVIQFASSVNDYGVFLEVDNSGDIVVVGSFGDTVDFDPGPSVYIITEQALFGPATFICKLSGNGAFIWAGAIQSGSGLWNHRMTLDEADNIYLAQHFEQTIDVDPTEDTLLISSSPFFSSAFVCKIYANGQLGWVYTITGAAGTSSIGIYPATIAVADGSVQIGGTYYGSAVFDMDSPMEVHTGVADGFVLSLDSSGSFNWVHAFSTDDMGVRALTASGGSLYGAGYSSNGVTDCSPEGSVVPLDADIFIFKWSDGSPVGFAEKPFGLNGSPSFYPNPTADFVWIEFPSPIELEVRVYTALGRLITKSTYQDSERIKLELGEIPGMYQVVLNYSDRTESFKVIKE